MASRPIVWSLVHGPAAGLAEAIGGYSAGCVQGAIRLPFVGSGFRVARPERNRVWGHPALIGFLKQLGDKARTAKLPQIFIGDLGQPRGGPAPTGHASHQTGLDVDVSYMPYQNGNAPSMLDDKREKPNKLFTARVIQLLKFAVADPRVDRIFVHPALKRALCHAAGDHGWLHKLRPWWGHNDHFHVRLACPAGNRECQAQATLPPGDGCGEIDWWFRKEAEGDRQKAHEAYSSKVGAGPTLPLRCDAVLGAK